MHQRGRTIALIGESGSGKTTQIGEYAKWIKKQRGLSSLLHCADMGGYDSLLPHVRAGILEIDEFDPSSDVWEWVDQAAAGTGLAEQTGMVAFDSGTSIGEGLLSAAAKASAQGVKIGSQNILRFTVGKKTIGANTESHYGVVQSYLLDQIWKSTWLTRRGIDVLWTFSVYRGEGADQSPILGPLLAGKALTGKAAKWFNYSFFIEEVPEGEGLQHVLHLQSRPQLTGGRSVGNPRYPLDATTPLPVSIIPASLPKAFELIEAGQKEADEALALELSL